MVHYPRLGRLWTFLTEDGCSVHRWLIQLCTAKEKELPNLKTHYSKLSLLPKTSFEKCTNCLHIPSNWVRSLWFSRFILLLWPPGTRAITWFSSFRRRAQPLASLRDRVDHFKDRVSEVKLSLVLYWKYTGLLGVDEHGSKVDIANRWDRVLAVDWARADFDGNAGDYFTAFTKMGLYDLRQPIAIKLGGVSVRGDNIVPSNRKEERV